METIQVRLHGGPANGRTIEISCPAPGELHIEVVRTLRFRLHESVGGADPVRSDEVAMGSERHRYRLFGGDPAVGEWLGKVET